MKLCFFTLALDAMPFITWHLPAFQKLECDWHWYIAEGVARPVKDTSWCKEIPPRLSNDGTTEYLNSIKAHPKVTVVQRPWWHGKTAMVNDLVQRIEEPCLLMQIDSDEIWTPEQLMETRRLFREESHFNCAYFRCRYFVGLDIITKGINCYGNNPGEWMRAWRWYPGMSFAKHEPPQVYGINVPDRMDESGMNPEMAWLQVATEARGLVFDHYAYATEKQVAFKAQYYGYKDAVAGWKRLQQNLMWPVPLKPYLPWVDSRVRADKVR